MAALARSDSSDGPIISDNVIRIQLRKPSHRKWELTTRNRKSGVLFPVIQLFDCDGNILVETNDGDVSIRSSDLKSSQSLNESNRTNRMRLNTLKKSNSIAGGKVYTRLYENNTVTKDIKRVNESPKRRWLGVMSSRKNSNESAIISSDVTSDQEPSSFKSTDNESSALEFDHTLDISNDETLQISPNNDIRSPLELKCAADGTLQNDNKCQTDPHSFLKRKPCLQRQNNFDEHDDRKLLKSKSFHATANHYHLLRKVRRSQSQLLTPTGIAPSGKKVSFLETHMRSLPNRKKSRPDWCSSAHNGSQSRDCSGREFLTKSIRTTKEDKMDSDVPNLSSDTAAVAELYRRLEIYRRVLTFPKGDEKKSFRIRQFSEGDRLTSESSSSESPDEADAVLNRLRRRILKNRLREKRSYGATEPRTNKRRRAAESPDACAAPDAPIEECRRTGDMGSNISHHSIKGLTGRRARSSGDLCNGEAKSPTETAAYGSVVGEVVGWNRSLPNHLDGNRHLAGEYNGTLPRGNNNYGESLRYNPKGVRAWRYHAYKAGSDAEPVWRLQDGCDQGYGSERSPEEEGAPHQAAVLDYPRHEAQLRRMYPFITEENTFTVVVEKDGRGLGMSVSGGEEGGGLVRIRRLYPPQPAWRTGRLAPRDLLLAANGVPLTGLSTYEALEVLRTTAPRVELRVCRPPPDALDCLTPPAPPTPPTRHTPAAPLDPLNCHPMHTRLSATTSSATTSSSEGRHGSTAGAQREDLPPSSPLPSGPLPPSPLAPGSLPSGPLSPSPLPPGGYDRPDSLRLPEFNHQLPVYDVQYGEFDIIMSKVNGSLGFTLRKEDHSALGHYVRALVREPALSDGRIMPGDRIVAVNEVPMSGMSHADAVSFLRSCDAEVRLRLYRDHAATPLSPLSPQESRDRHSPSDSDTTIVRPKPHLRQEAVNMLSDLAARRLTPDANDGSRSPGLSPRKHRRLTRDGTEQSQSSDLSVDRSHQIYFVDFPTTTDVNTDSENFRIDYHVTPQTYQLNSLDSAVLDAPNVYRDRLPHRYEPAAEPLSMPLDVSASPFSHTNPTYQSAVVHPSCDPTGEGNRDDANCLKKWKVVALSPENERKTKLEPKPKMVDDQKENLKPAESVANKEPTILTVELNRGWNSRLGFSIQSNPESGQSYVSAIYSDSVAARDGRLKKGDVILQVNDENVTCMKTSEVIELMRILRGSICITVLRPG